jgi:3D-(3,5/4)-trihydroxycyclohexane-1,2-dione acylhydrolase (decyclizing)
MKKIRLTMAQALVRYLAAQRIETPSGLAPLFHGVFAIYGHGNVAGMGEALAAARTELPVFRAHNEQAMAHAAIAFAKASNREDDTARIRGPGATNPCGRGARPAEPPAVLLLPGDTFAGRQPDPVLQQIEDFGKPTVTVNDCLKPVSRFWDRLTRPEQVLASLPQAIAVLLDPAECGPATLALPQDVQAEAFDYPESFFEQRVHVIERPRPDRAGLAAAVGRIRASRRPIIVPAAACNTQAASSRPWRGLRSAMAFRSPKSRAGKGALRWDHPS